MLSDVLPRWVLLSCRDELELDLGLGLEDLELASPDGESEAGIDVPLAPAAWW